MQQRKSCQQKRLCKSSGNRQVFGVAGGVAEYLNIDPTLVRLAFVLLTMAGGPGVVLYIILAVIVPKEPEFVQTSAEKSKRDEIA